MDKKWGQMSLDEKMQWHRRHPWVMTSYKVLFSIIGILILWAVFTPNDFSFQKHVSFTQEEYDQFSPQQQTGICKERSNSYFQLLAAKKVTEKYGYDMVNPPSQLSIINPKTATCLLTGNITLNDSSGKQTTKTYQVLYRFKNDEVVWEKVEVGESKGAN
jgi:hypothetical protein